MRLTAVALVIVAVAKVSSVPVPLPSADTSNNLLKDNGASNVQSGATLQRRVELNTSIFGKVRNRKTPTVDAEVADLEGGATSSASSSDDESERLSRLAGNVGPSYSLPITRPGRAHGAAGDALNPPPLTRMQMLRQDAPLIAAYLTMMSISGGALYYFNKDACWLHGTCDDLKKKAKEAEEDFRKAREAAQRQAAGQSGNKQ